MCVLFHIEFHSSATIFGMFERCDVMKNKFGFNVEGKITQNKHQYRASSCRWNFETASPHYHHKYNNSKHGQNWDEPR